MENEAITQVMEAEVCPNAEELVPLTEEQADALGVVEAGERIQAIGEHCIQMVGKASDFVLRYLGEIKSMRKRYAQPGRRNPIPGFPTWGKVKDKYFWFISDTHLRRLLAEPKKVKELSASTEEPTPERPQAVAEEIVGVEMKDAPQTGAAPPRCGGAGAGDPARGCDPRGARDPRHGEAGAQCKTLLDIRRRRLQEGLQFPLPA